MKKLISMVVLIAVFVSMGTTVFAQNEATENSTFGTMRPYCANEYYETKTSTNIFTGTVTYRTYCWHNSTDGFAIELRTGTHECTVEKYDKNGIFLSLVGVCPYGGGTGSASIDLK